MTETTSIIEDGKFVKPIIHCQICGTKDNHIWYPCNYCSEWATCENCYKNSKAVETLIKYHENTHLCVEDLETFRAKSYDQIQRNDDVVKTLVSNIFEQQKEIMDLENQVKNLKNKTCSNCKNYNSKRNKREDIEKKLNKNPRGPLKKPHPRPPPSPKKHYTMSVLTQVSQT